jgi:hypothetical protein
MSGDRSGDAVVSRRQKGSPCIPSEEKNLKSERESLRNLQICTVCGAVVGYDTGLFTLMCSDQTRVWFGLDS